MQLPITIGLHRSLFWATGILAAHGLAVVAILLTPWLFWFKGVGIAGLAASAFSSWRAGKPKVKAMRLLGDGQMQCRRTEEDGFIPAEILPSATVHPWLTVIRLRLAENIVVAMVFPDSVTPEDFRRLRIWLRWRADFSAGKDVA